MAKILAMSAMGFTDFHSTQKLLARRDTVVGLDSLTKRLG